MIENCGVVLQAFLGTLFTWGLTATGASVVVFIRGSQRKLLDASLGFAAGVMVAASFWSLLSPAIEMAEESKLYGENGQFAFIPVGIGFLLGALFVYGADVFITAIGITSPSTMLALLSAKGLKEKREDDDNFTVLSHLSTVDTTKGDEISQCSINMQYRKRGRSGSIAMRTEEMVQARTYEDVTPLQESKNSQWKRIMLMVVAITVHNIPEGLAVGVGFGAIGSSPSATFESARNLAIGIGIQNFPEGLAVSLPLHAAGYSTWRSLWYGQLSGMVEPLFGVLGALTVSLVQPVLPYALAFAAGAMIYVVVDDIIPEAITHGNGKLASWSTIVGFLVMMTLDVGLG
ncbi:zinc transporter ZIP11 isoform X1 [Agrilus planipennis]|uniref:Zinc transporter ZIP11 n=1 Tax=Agrilus planipennis TaxID=224129 RepID=A0A1W4XDD6_AGRPL|nr:zinc transporter ZIP11 isoform X1 [Agrilus planipennis]